MERLKLMKEQLMSAAQGQMGNLDCVDAKELGEVIDMIKDLAEATYYCSITEAMEESKEQPKANNYYYTQPMMNPRYDYDMGKMYYDGGNGRNGNSSSYYTQRQPYYREQPYNMDMMYDSRQGRSPMSRKMYMESKDMHKDPVTQMRELESYVQDLTQDITEMIQSATPEEKQVLQQKIATLASKIK